MTTKTFYHKASVTGLMELMTNLELESSLCVSTNDSAHLFWRDVCVVLTANTSNIAVESENDIDSHSVTAHDEARLIFETKEDFLNSIDHIILDGRILRTIKAGKFNSPDAVPGELMSEFFTGNHDDAQKQAIAKFYTDREITTLTNAKKINKKWNREFLNI